MVLGDLSDPKLELVRTEIVRADHKAGAWAWNMARSSQVSIVSSTITASACARRGRVPKLVSIEAQKCP